MQHADTEEVVAIYDVPVVRMFTYLGGSEFAKEDETDFRCDIIK